LIDLIVALPLSGVLWSKTKFSELK